MGKSKTMVETEFLDDDMKNGFCNLTPTSLCFPGGHKKAKEKSVESENEFLEASRIAVDSYLCHGMQS
jgi:hypothetical protein